jgi:protein-disulfide isomerase
VTRNPGSSIGAAIVGGLIGAGAMAALLVFATPQAVSSRIVRQGLMADPQVLMDTADALRDRQTAPVVDTHRAALEKPFASSWEGSEKPDVTLVEFFDYACAYCRASLPHVDRLLKEDKNLRVVYRELPILGPESVAAARVSLAASKSGRFNQFHDALYSAGRPGAETITAAATVAGVPPQPAPDPEVEAELNRNMQLASQLGASGTPTFVVGDRVLNGAVGYEALKAAVAAARSSQSAAGGG